MIWLGSSVAQHLTRVHENMDSYSENRKRKKKVRRDEKNEGEKEEEKEEEGGGRRERGNRVKAVIHA